MKSSTKAKPYWEMTVEELREATKEFDRPIPLSKTRPLTKSERASFERARAGGIHSVRIRRKPLAREVNVKLEAELLRRSSAYATKHNMSLSELISRSLKSALTFVE